MLEHLPHLVAAVSSEAVASSDLQLNFSAVEQVLDCHLNLVWEQLEEVHHPKKSRENFKIMKRKLPTLHSIFMIFLSWRKNPLKKLWLIFFCCNFWCKNISWGKESGAQQFSSMQAKEVYFLKSLGKNGRQLKVVYPCRKSCNILECVYVDSADFSLPRFFPIYNIDETFSTFTD